MIRNAADVRKQMGQERTCIKCALLPCLQMDLCFCECPALALGLELHHVGEDTAFLQQLCGRTLLGYCTILEYHDLVRAGDSAHPVGDNEDGLVLNKSGKCLLNGCFVLHV